MSSKSSTQSSLSSKLKEGRAGTVAFDQNRSDIAAKRVLLAGHKEQSKLPPLPKAEQNVIKKVKLKCLSFERL